MGDSSETMARIGARSGLAPSDRVGLDVSASTYGPERTLADSIA